MKGLGPLISEISTFCLYDVMGRHNDVIKVKIMKFQCVITSSKMDKIIWNLIGVFRRVTSFNSPDHFQGQGHEKGQKHIFWNNSGINSHRDFKSSSFFRGFPLT